MRVRNAENAFSTLDDIVKELRGKYSYTKAPIGEKLYLTTFVTPMGRIATISIDADDTSHQCEIVPILNTLPAQYLREIISIIKHSFTYV